MVSTRLPRVVSRLHCFLCVGASETFCSLCWAVNVKLDRSSSLLCFASSEGEEPLCVLNLLDKHEVFSCLCFLINVS